MLARYKVSRQQFVIVVNQNVDVASRVGLVKRIGRLLSLQDTKELFNDDADLGTHEFSCPKG